MNHSANWRVFTGRTKNFLLVSHFFSQSNGFQIFTIDYFGVWICQGEKNACLGTFPLPEQDRFSTILYLESDFRFVEFHPQGDIDF
jgi:hypothetical protein